MCVTCVSCVSRASHVCYVCLMCVTCVSCASSQELLHRTDQLYHMAAVISMTMQEEDTSSQKTVEYITQLECENRHLRDLLQFTQSGVLEAAIDRTRLDSSTPVNSPATGPPLLSSSKSPPSTSTPPPAPRPEIRTITPHSAGFGAEGYMATPQTSGQTTPVVGREGSAGPLLQQACDVLSDSHA